MDNEYLDKKLKEIKEIPLKEIIEAFGGVFTSTNKFEHPFFAEKTPSCSIYVKNGEEKWKCFGRGLGGDAVQFVATVTGCNDFKEAIKKILGDDHSYKVMSEEEKKKYQEERDRKEKEKADKDRKKIYAIKNNSRSIRGSKEAMLYFHKRGLLKTVLNLKDSNIEILCNKYKDKNGANRISIVYFFKGNKNKNLNSFMVTKGINSNGNKTGLKLNVRESRPIIHMSNPNTPILVTEGIEDALTGKALSYDNFMSLNSTSAINRLIVTMNTCRTWYLKNEFELALDNDTAGIKAINDIKVFCNIASIYKEEKLDEFINYLRAIGKETDNMKDAERLIKIFNENKDLEKMEPTALLDAIKLTNSVLKENFFENFGSVYKIKESDFVNLMKEFDKKDLNELFVDIIAKPKEIDSEKLPPSIESLSKNKVKERVL